MSHGKELLTGLKRDYFKAPNGVFELGMSTAAITLYCFFASCADKFDPPLSAIARRLGLNRKTVARAMGELEAKGLVTAERVQCEGTKTRVRWRFVDPIKWVQSAGNMARPKSGPAPDQKTDSIRAEKGPLTIKNKTKKKQSDRFVSDFLNSPPLEDDLTRLRRMAAQAGENREKFSPLCSLSSPSPLGMGPGGLTQDQLMNMRTEYALQGRDPDEAGFESWRYPPSKWGS